MKDTQQSHDLVSLKSRMAVITGGSNRTGRAIAERLAETGASVIIADINLINAEIAVQAIIDKYKIMASSICLNDTEEHGIASAVKTITENWGEVDIWINTSNLFHHQRTLDMNDEELARLAEKNMEELFFNCRKVANHMKASKIEGIIINVISVKDFTLLSGLPHNENIDRHISAETNALSEELKSSGIKLFTIAPVAKQKAMGNRSDNSSEIIEYATPDDVAMLVIFCISILSKNMTGQVLRLNGKKIVIDSKH